MFQSNRAQQIGTSVSKVFRRFRSSISRFRLSEPAQPVVKTRSIGTNTEVTQGEFDINTVDTKFESESETDTNRSIIRTGTTRLLSRGDWHRKQVFPIPNRINTACQTNRLLLIEKNKTHLSISSPMTQVVIDPTVTVREGIERTPESCSVGTQLEDSELPNSELRDSESDTDTDTASEHKPVPQNSDISRQSQTTLKYHRRRSRNCKIPLHLRSTLSSRLKCRNEVKPEIVPLLPHKLPRSKKKDLILAFLDAKPISPGKQYTFYLMMSL